MIPTRIWKIYILPFLFILAVIAVDSFTTTYNQHIPFKDLAHNTNALAEIDIRTFEKAHVAKVVDGDTIELTTGEKVRYIGIDTPETKHPNKGVQCFGREAAKRNKELIEGKEIRMEKDISNTDRYDRLLRYIYLPNPDASDEAIFINEFLVEQGYARVLTYPPDVKYDSLLKEAEKKARQENTGLWQKCN